MLLFFLINLLDLPAQIQVGTGTGTQSNLPIASCYGYTYSQQIYLQSDINAAGTITAISFYYVSSGTTYANWKDWVIYLGQTSKSSFASTSDWEPVSGLTEVFNGVIPTPVPGSWVTITLNTPFVYNNTSNLLVAIDENTPGYSCTATWRFTPASGTRGIYYRSDSTNPNPTTPPTATGTTASIANILLTGLVATTPPNCTMLTSPANSATGVNEDADLSWAAAAGGATGYKITMGTSSGGNDVLDNENVGNVTTYDPGTLGYSTAYYVTITAYNVNGDATGCTETSFTTRADPTVTAPYTESFESFTATTNSSISTGGWLSNPSGTTSSFRWDVDASGSTPSSPTGPTNGAHDGSKYLYTEASSGLTGAIAELTSPPIDISGLSAPYLTFYYHMFGSTMGTLNVDVYDGTSWTNAVWSLTGQQQATGTDPWLEAGVDLSGYSGTIKIRLRGVRGTDFYGDMSIDLFNVDEAPACPNLTALMSAGVTNNSASFSWAAASGATSYNWEVVSSGSGQGSGIVASGSASGTTETATGLSAQTSYDIYVQSVCSGGNGNWVGPISVTTACDAISTFPYTENFDGLTQPALPSCVSQINNNADGDFWKTWTSYARSSPNSAGLYTDGNSGNNDDYLVLPPMVLTGNERLKYWVRARSSSEPNDYQVVLSTTGAAAGNFTNTLLPLTTVSSITYTEVIIDLSAYSGTVNIAFHVPSGGLDGWYIYIDDVTVEDIPACPDLTALMSTGVTNNSASFSWTASANATSYNWEVVSSGSGQGSGIVASGSASGTTETATGLSAQTGYDIYVQSVCSGGNGAWVGPISVTTSCDAYTIPYLEGFESGYSNGTVIAGCFSQESVAGSGSWAANSSNTNYNRTPRTGSFNATLVYSNTDWLFVPVNLTGGTSYTVECYARQDGATAANSNVTISYGTANTSAGMTNTIVAATGIINGDYQQITGAFTPSSTGVYYIGIQGYMNGSPWYISLDDISVIESPACPSPSAGATTNVSGTIAAFSWTENGTATNWDWEIVPAGSGQGVSVVTSGSETTTTASATGLSGETDYDFYYRSDCGSSSYSTWVGPVSFTTLVDCATTTNSGSGTGATDTYNWANSYAASGAPTYSFVDPVAAGHTEITAWTDGSDDDGYFTIPDIGFPFLYFDGTYQTADVHIGTNGQIMLGTNPLANTNAQTSAIQVAMMDLDDRADGKIYYQTSATELIVTYWHYHDYLDDTEWVTAQVRMYPDGTIQINFNDAESSIQYGAGSFGADARIGLSETSVGTVDYRSNGSGGPIFCSPVAVEFAPAAPLPIELTSFTGKTNGEVNILNWTTATELDVNMHVIERSPNGVNQWESIGQVAGQLNSTRETKYEFVDNKPLRSAFYRLKTIDLNESNQVSDMILLTRASGGFGVTNVFPSPAVDKVSVQFETMDESDVYVQVTDLTGRIVVRQQASALKGLNNYDLFLTELASGTYMISILDGSVMSAPYRIVKQ